MSDDHTLSIRASTPMGYFTLGGLTAACLRTGMPAADIRAVSTEDDLEVHVPAHWVVHAALLSLPKYQEQAS